MSQPSLKPLEIEDLLIQYRSDQRKLEYQLHKLQSIIQELEKQFAEVREALSLEEAKVPPSAGESKAAPAAEAKPEKPKKRRGRPPKAKAADDATTKKAAPPEAKAETAAEKPAAKSTSKKRTTQKASSGKKRGPGRPPKSDAEKKKSTRAAKKDAKGKENKPPRLSEWDKFVVESLKAKQQALITNDFLDIAKGNPDIKSGEAQIKVKLNRSLHKLANRKGLLVKVEHSGRGYAYALVDWVNSKGELPKKFAR